MCEGVKWRDKWMVLPCFLWYQSTYCWSFAVTLNSRLQSWRLLWSARVWSDVSCGLSPLGGPLWPWVEPTSCGFDRQVFAFGVSRRPRCTGEERAHFVSQKCHFAPERCRISSPFFLLWERSFHTFHFRSKSGVSFIRLWKSSARQAEKNTWPCNMLILYYFASQKYVVILQRKGIVFLTLAYVVGAEFSIYILSKYEVMSL